MTDIDPLWLRSFVAVAESGAQRNELPRPTKPSATSSTHSGVSGRRANDSATMEMISVAKPNPASTRGWIRSVREPTRRAARIETSAIGASSSPAWVGL